MVRYRNATARGLLDGPQDDAQIEKISANLLIATKADVEAHFNTHGTGEITEIKLMNGFGFIEYKDAMDARDVVPGMAA